MTLSPPRRPHPDSGLGARLRESDLWRARSVGALIQDATSPPADPANPDHTEPPSPSPSLSPSLSPSPSPSPAALREPESAAPWQLDRSASWTPEPAEPRRSRSRRSPRPSPAPGGGQGRRRDGIDGARPGGSRVAADDLDSWPGRPGGDSEDAPGFAAGDDALAAALLGPVADDHEPAQQWDVAGLAEKRSAGLGRRWAELDRQDADAAYDGLGEDEPGGDRLGDDRLGLPEPDSARVSSIADRVLERSRQDAQSLERSSQDLLSLERSSRDTSGQERSSRDALGVERSGWGASADLGLGGSSVDSLVGDDLQGDDEPELPRPDSARASSIADRVLERSRQGARDPGRSSQDARDPGRSSQDARDLERSRQDARDLERSRQDARDLERSRQDARDLERSRQDARDLERSRQGLPVELELGGSSFGALGGADLRGDEFEGRDSVAADHGRLLSGGVLERSRAYAPVDAGTDVGADVGSGVGSYVGAAVGTDAGPDVGTDVGTFVGVDGGACVGVEGRGEFAGLGGAAFGGEDGLAPGAPGWTGVRDSHGAGSFVPEEDLDLRSVAELVDRLDGDDVVDADDVVGEMAALGLDDDVARERYGMSMRGVGVSVLTHLAQRRAQRGLRRAPAKRPYLPAAMVRCTLYLGPLGVAMAGAGVLGRLAWPVTAVILLLGWGAAQGLTGLGCSVARTAGPASAARLVGGGFFAAAGIWAAFVWVAPSAWLGPSRMLALVAGLGGLTALSTVTAALVTRAEAGVIRWSLPCWLLGAVSVAAALGGGWAARVPVETLLPAAIVVAAVRAYRPVIGRAVPDRPPLERGAKRRGLGYLIIGLAQAVAVVLLWRAGASVLAALPLLLTVPVLETLVGWHLYQVETGLDATESGRDYRRHVRSVAITTVAALLPPLAAGIALAAAAYRLPYGPQTRDGVLALAAGTLLGGLLAATFLIAARGHTLAAASLAAAAPLAIVLLPLAPLPAAVAAFAGTLLLGLLTVAHIAADHRRTP